LAGLTLGKREEDVVIRAGSAQTSAGCAAGCMVKHKRTKTHALSSRRRPKASGKKQQSRASPAEDGFFVALACAVASLTRSLLTGLDPLSQRGEKLYKGHPSSVARAQSTPDQRYAVCPYIPPRHTHPRGSAASTTPAPAFPTKGAPHARMARQVAARAAAKRIGRFDLTLLRRAVAHGIRCTAR
jgi:hypothetical protein